MTIGARLIVRGSIWLIGAQFVGFVLQFGYAAVSARLVGPAVFGSYAVALASMVLVGILASAGLGQALTRTVAMPRASERAIVTMALLLGLVAALCVVIFAQIWVSLWVGDANAVAAVRWLALSTLLTPYMGVVVAFARRAGEFRFLALAQLLAAASGMLVGVALIYVYRDTQSLVANMIITQFGILLIVGGKHSYQCMPGRVRREDLRQLRFSLAVTGTNILYYVQQNLPKWSIGRFLGGAELGYWNRGEVVTAVPFQSVQVALLQTVYPQFAHLEDDVRRQREGWTDMIILVAWICVPAGTLGFVILPAMIPLLYGPVWSSVSSIVGVLAMAYCVLPIMSALASGLEQRGMFREILISLFVGIAMIVPFSVAAIRMRHAVIAGVGLGVSFAIQHLLHLLFAHRSKLIGISRTLTEYAIIVSLCGVVLALKYALERLSPFFGYSDDVGLLLSTLGGILILIGGGALATLKHLGPFMILRKRNVLSR